MRLFAECRLGATYILALLVLVSGCWAFFVGVYFAGGEGLRRWKQDDERFIFGMLGGLFTFLALLPFDPLGGSSRPRTRSLFPEKYRQGCWVNAFEYFRQLVSAGAGAFNLYNAAAMGTEKTLALQSEGGSCSDARYVAPAIASITYMAAVLPAGARVRAVAVSLPVTALLTLLLLHSNYVDSDAPTNRLAGSIVAAVTFSVAGLSYITVFTVTSRNTENSCHKTAKGIARFLEVLSPALAAAFGWFYWHQGWSESLDPPFEKWIIPAATALFIAIFRFAFYIYYSNIPIAPPRPGADEDGYQRNRRAIMDKPNRLDGDDEERMKLLKRTPPPLPPRTVDLPPGAPPLLSQSGDAAVAPSAVPSGGAEVAPDVAKSGYSYTGCSYDRVPYRSQRMYSVRR